MNRLSKSLLPLSILALLSGCASTPLDSPRATEYLLCGTAGAITGGLVGGALSMPLQGIAAGSALALAVCPSQTEEQTTSLSEKDAELETRSLMDDDNDGIANSYDLCSDSNKGEKVNNDGCPLLSDALIPFEKEVSCSKSFIDKNTPGTCTADSKTIFATSEVNFSLDSYQLTKEAKARLSELVTFINETKPNYIIKVIGHTDSTGSRRHNQKLSEKRARTVMEYLISTGIAPKSFTYEGQGETKPIASNNTTSGRARNRRVEFKAFY